MNLRSLTAFRAVMEFGTVTAAANHLNVTQPAMSRLISSLEEELGIKLFNRRRKRLFPTPEAEVFYREAQRILAAVDEIPQLVQDIRTHAGSRIRVVAMARAAETFVVPALQRFTEAFPHINHTVEILARVHMERWVSRQQFDIGVGALPAVHEALRTEELCRIPAVAVMSSSHPLAGRSAVSVSELGNEPLIVPKTGTMIRRYTNEILEESGVVPRIRTETGNGVLACQLAGIGVGVTISDALTPRSIVATDAAIVPIKPRFDMVFGILYPSAGKPDTVTLAFTSFLKEVASEKLKAVVF